MLPGELTLTWLLWFQKPQANWQQLLGMSKLIFIVDACYKIPGGKEEQQCSPLVHKNLMLIYLNKHLGSVIVGIKSFPYAYYLLH